MNIKDMNFSTFAGYVCSELEKGGVSATLSGGGCVTIYSNNRFMSNDLDFITNGSVAQEEVRIIMLNAGFKQDGRYFKHEDSKFFVEFPTGPLMVGSERITNVRTIKTTEGDLKLLSPTDCIKDRLISYFVWNDKQGLEQAITVTNNNTIDFNDLNKWIIKEGFVKEYEQVRKSFDDKENKQNNPTTKKRGR